MQKLAQICIRRPVFATMLVLALVVMGLDAYRKLGVDFFPKIEFPTVTVTTTLRGAAPEEVESQVTKTVEEAVNTISGIDDLRSISAEGISQVFVTFVLEKNADVAAQEVRDKVAAVLRDLPRDADPPVIEKVATDASPVVNIVVSSNRDLRETTKIVDDEIKKNIESINGVGQVRFIGDRTREIQVWLDGEKLYSYNLTIDQVRNALAQQNVEIPGGRIEQGARELSLRTLGRVERPKDFERVVVATVGGVPVRVSDIARVEDGVEEPRSLARLDGNPAVILEVRKQAGTNTLDVIQGVKDRIGSLKQNLPPDFRITYSRDQSEFIKESFKAVQEHLVLGGFFAAFIVLLFIRSWRSTLIAAVAIPTSIISTYTLMNWMGFTLNQITMLALVLMVGIVIDDAIVVLENIFRFMEEKKLPPVQAAIEGTRDIGLAVMTTTFSLVIIFLPVALMGGIVGRFMSSFGYTAAFAVMVSLLVSFTLTPMLCSKFLRPSANGNGGSTKETFFFRILAGPYQRMLRWSMSHRWAIVAGAIFTVLTSAPLFMTIGKDFLPVDDQSQFEVTVRAPVGSSLDGSDGVFRQLESELRTLPGVEHIVTTIGADYQRQVDRGSILIDLVPMDQRKEKQADLMLMARRRLARFRDLVIGVQLPSLIQGGGTNKDLQFYLQGPDLDRLARYSTQIRKQLAAVQGVVDIDSSYEAGKPEVRVNINRDRAADLNVNVASIANALRILVGGDDQVTTYREGDDRYNVMLRVQEEFRNSPAALDRLYLPSATLGSVPVSNVATLAEASGPVQIERYNRQRQILLSANLIEGQALSNVIPILDRTVEGLNLPPQYRSGLVGRSKEFGRASASYVIAFVLSIVFMYMVLAAQFDSFLDPVIILLSLPLSVPFALLSLLLTGENFSIIYSSLGILVLFGIVKKNAILQIDHIKSLRAHEGLPRLEAILKGCEDRLRPILMTTASLVAGMIPLALGGGPGSGSRRTVAIVVIGGQSLCLLLTLLVTPVAFSLADDMRQWAPWRRFALRRAWGSISGLFAVLCLLAVSAAPAFSQARVGVTAIQRRLTLQQAVEMALAKNLEIEIERTNTATARQALRAAQGAFDPLFQWMPGIASRATPTSSVLVGPSGKLSERFHTQNFAFRQRFPWSGSGFGASFDNSRQSTSNPFTSLTPFVTSSLNLSFTQPLLRSRVIDRERADIRIRRKQIDLSDAELELKVIDVITRVQQAYWDLAAAREDETVQRDSVELAGEQLGRNKRMIDAGTLAPVELAAAKAELERRRDTWLASIATVTSVENHLKTLLAPGRDSELWNEEIVPVEARSPEPPLANLQEAVTRALKQRPELRLIGLSLESNAVRRELNANQVKPKVDFTASYTNTGLGGAVSERDNPFSAANRASAERLNELSQLAGLAPLPPSSFGSVPAILIGGYGTALSNLFQGRFQTIQVGVSLDLNLRNRTAEANLSQALVEEKRLRLERAQVEQAIEAQVRNALQAIESARQRIAAAQASERAAREKLESETRLFQTGESTNFLVLTRQNEYADSRRRRIVAALEFNRAVARLDQALGATLQSHNMTLH